MASASPATAPAQRVFLSKLRLEVNVTPRWFAPGPHFADDVHAIFSTWQEVGGDLWALCEDVQAGLSGVRLVLTVPADVSTSAVEEARLALVAALDALDLASPRRRRVTEARNRPVRAVPSPEAPEAVPPAAEPALPPSRRPEEPSGEGPRSEPPPNYSAPEPPGVPEP